MSRFEELSALLENAWCPYSGFQVAAIVVTEEGRAFRGVNVESAAYPTTICAERNAIQTAVTEGCRPGAIVEVHLLARNREGEYQSVYPCGACRQVIAEQSLLRAEVFVYDGEGGIRRHGIGELLPHAFFLEEGRTDS
jgi:cytidine deaminase